MSTNIIRTRERVKNTGEVFTPTDIVNNMLDVLPCEAFTDHSKLFCDPSCGDGQILIEIIKRKLKNGSTAWEAATTVYGVDLMLDNVDLCRKRIRKILKDHVIKHEGAKELPGGIKRAVNKNIICCDTFLWDFDNWCTKEETRKKREEKYFS